MIIKPIRSEADYDASLERMELLMDAEPGTPEGDELDLLATLIDRYEEQQFPIAAPTPLAAIRFRMEQQGLSVRDLEPFIGSRARVSEVLSGVRSLSIDMIRALNQHLGIPADVLIRPEPMRVGAPGRRPSATVLNRLRGWGLLGASESFEAFFERACAPTPGLIRLRKSRTDRTNAKTDSAAQEAWCAAVSLLAAEIPVADRAMARPLDDALLTTLGALSRSRTGPAKVAEILAEYGVVFVVTPHLPGTYLDGAAMRRADGVPVIALTVRHDRIDNFWFTLLHECVHVMRHLEADAMIIDDLEVSTVDAEELEADAVAEEALIPAMLWDRFLKIGKPSVADVIELARAADVHPAIVAGRWQNLTQDFRTFSRLLGRKTVRPQFEIFATERR